MAVCNIADGVLLTGPESSRHSLTVPQLRGSPLQSYTRCRRASGLEFQRGSHIAVAASTDARSRTRKDRRPSYEDCRPERQNLVALITESLETEVRIKIVYNLYRKR